MGKISGLMFVYPYSGVCVEFASESSSLASRHSVQSSAEMSEKVVAARKLQRERFVGTTTKFNSEMNLDQLEKFSRLDCGEQIGRVARTIADLAASYRVHDDHLNEARQLAVNDPAELCS
jgi:magnesium chelatase family protein